MNALKMKITFATNVLEMALVALFIIVVLLLHGCANGPQLSIKGQSPAQVAAQVCPVVQMGGASLALLPLPASVQADLALAKPVVDAVCTVGSAVTSGKLQSMAGQVLPALSGAVLASPLSDADKQRIALALSAASIVLNGYFALNPQLTAIGTSVPAPASAASAP